MTKLFSKGGLSPPFTLSKIKKWHRNLSQSINILQKIQPNKNKEIIDRLNTAINFAKNSNVILVQNIKITIDSNK